MSFLDAVLSSIGTSTSTPNPAKSTTTPSTKSSDVTTNIPITNLSIKRKAEDDLKKLPDKTPKVERSTTTFKPAERPIKPLPLAKPNVATSSAPAAPESAQTSSKNPKKGSFAAIMARAKEAQAQPTNSTGSITHKPKDKVKTKTRRELVMEREAAKKAAKKGLPFTGLANDKDGKGKDTVKKSATERPNSATKKAGDQATSKTLEKSGYQGTMQPSNASKYTGTARPKNPPSKAISNSRDPGQMKSGQPSKQRRYYDESEDNESEDGYDYASEDYSDMDAGFDDMEDEEEQAERIARREDAKEQAELERLKREKERKKMLLEKGKR